LAKRKKKKQSKKRKTALRSEATVDALRRKALEASQADRVDVAELHLLELVSLPQATSLDFYSLGLAQETLGKLPEAIGSFGRCVAGLPAHIESLLHLGVLQVQINRLEDAAASYARAQQIDPSDPAIVISQCQVLHRLRRFEEAIELLTPLLEGKETEVNARYVLGAIYQDRRDFDRALEHYDAIRHCSPNTSGLANNLAMLYTEVGRFDEAITIANEVLETGDECAALYNSRGNAYLAMRRLKEAGQDFHRAFELDPTAWMSFSNEIMIQHYRDDIPAETIAANHRAFGVAMAEAFPDVKRVWSGIRDVNRRLRIGFVSPDFRSHSVAFFFEPVLQHRDRSRFEVFCYSAVRNPDPFTTKFQRLADHWRDIRPLLPEQAEALVRADGIDILIDLAGHSGDNSMPLFGRKPAPVQVTWLGYPNTTGLATMDYRLTDAIADPRGKEEGDSDTMNSEELVRLPNGFLCYRPVEDCPPVAPLPARTRGSIVFGCFNKFDKISPTCVTLWSSILRDLPGSQLLIKNLGMNNPLVRNELTSWFAGEGIDEDRLVLHGRTKSIGDHLNLYGSVDIALDTTPYHGTTTTFEAVWMGVPVVVLAGDAHVSRVGVSILERIGGGDLITQSPQQYKDIALALAGDLDRLESIRGNLRDCLANSPLTDEPGFTRDFEAALLSMWQRYCTSPSPLNFTFGEWGQVPK
jgi:predicted O-linked N-acetylglucosamine transferase (SPINDLY family)